MISNRLFRPVSRTFALALPIVALSLAAVLGTDATFAQTGVPSANPSISSGSTQPYDARQLELQRVREAAQRARASAQQAAMARSADRATEQKHIQTNVERSMEVKQLKAQAARDAEAQGAANAYKGVSPGDIKAWSSADGDQVKVQREVPNNFTETIPKEKSSEDEDSGGIGGAVKGMFSWRPSIPFIGKKDKKEDPYAIPALPQFAPAESLGLGMVPPPVDAPPAKKSEADKEGFKLPLIGGLFSRDKNEQEVETISVAPEQLAASSAVASAPAPSYPVSDPGITEAPFALPSSEPIEEEKEGFLSRMNPFSGNDDDDKVADNTSPVADPGLFGPVGAPNVASGGNVASSAAQKKEDKPGFFGRMFGGGDKSNAGSGNADSGVYVVSEEAASLIKFGNSTVSSDSYPMPVGTVVRVTKGGEKWSNVQMPSGIEGIMRNSMIRPASSSEGTASMFAHLDKPQYPTTAKITSTRSATGASAAPEAPVYAPTPDLPSADERNDAPPMINGLLPPLPASSLE